MKILGKAGGESEYEELGWRNMSHPTTSTVELLMCFPTKAITWMTRALAIGYVTTTKKYFFALLLRLLGLFYSWTLKKRSQPVLSSFPDYFFYHHPQIYSTYKFTSTISILCPILRLTFAEIAKFQITGTI